MNTDVLIVGGGCGGCAAALAAASAGGRVVLTEETAWLGGQLTAQAVPPDENRWIESFGGTARYQTFRQAVRQYYKKHYPLTEEALRNPTLNPGQGRVSKLCAEPRVYEAVLEQMLAPYRDSGRIRVLTKYRPVAAGTNGDRVTEVTLRHTESGETLTVSARYFLDATELGDLLPLAKVEYVKGAESQEQTGEPHARSGAPDPDDQQAITWCFPMAFDPAPDADYVGDPPEQWARWREYVPALTPAWPGPLLSFRDCHPHDPANVYRDRELFAADPKDAKRDLWTYRRILGAGHYPADNRPHEVTLVNWPQNDYFEGSIVDQDEATLRVRLYEARQLSLSLFYWLQTEAPRRDGGQGYRGLYLVPKIAGTEDGLALAPYIRESRRIRAVFTLTENHVGVEARGGDEKEVSAEPLADSVGIGSYRIDLHPSTGGRNYIDVAAFPFQIPLGALLPVRVRNLIPACKNIGVTHVTNGCTRLHPVEWNIGESAGALAAYCLQEHTEPHAVREDRRRFEAFQDELHRHGIRTAWPQMES